MHAGADRVVREWEAGPDAVAERPIRGDEPAEEMIILAKHEARPEDRCMREYLSDGLFSLSLCAVGDRRRCQVGAEGRYVPRPPPGGAASSERRGGARGHAPPWPGSRCQLQRPKHRKSFKPMCSTVTRLRQR
jgi:hypothetical protein